MKKLFSIFAILAFMAVAPTITVKAQTVPTNMKTTWGATETSGAIFDTVKTSAAVYLYTGPIWGYKDVVNVVATATELTGTTAGTISLEYSADGTSWCNYYTSKDSTYSLTLTDVTTAQVYHWELHDWGGGYLRIKGVGVSTVSIDLRGKYYSATRRP